MGRRVCVITGAATGIGAASAIRFAQGGWDVAIGNFSEATRADAREVEKRCRGLHIDTLLFDVDVQDDAACRQAIEAVQQRFGRIDSLINSAGTTRFIPHGELEAIDAREFENLYRVNLIGMFQMTRAAEPLLRLTGERARCSTSVVNISSLAALNGSGSSIAYAASKGAVNTMTLSLARNLAPHVRVNAIAPGMVDDGLPRRMLGDEMYRKVIMDMMNSSPLKRVSRPDEVAELAWFISSSAPAVTGQVIAIENGLMLNL